MYAPQHADLGIQSRGFATKQSHAIRDMCFHALQFKPNADSRRERPIRDIPPRLERMSAISERMRLCTTAKA